MDSGGRPYPFLPRVQATRKGKYSGRASIGFSQEGQEDQEPRAILSYIASSRLAWAT